jgi:hypothetical protein
MELLFGKKALRLVGFVLVDRFAFVSTFIVIGWSCWHGLHTLMVKVSQHGCLYLIPSPPCIKVERTKKCNLFYQLDNQVFPFATKQEIYWSEHGLQFSTGQLFNTCHPTVDATSECSFDGRKPASGVKGSWLRRTALLFILIPRRWLPYLCEVVPRHLFP